MATSTYISPNTPSTPTTSVATYNPLSVITCYTANGQPVSIQTSTGSCPMGLFSKPPEQQEAFSPSDSTEEYVDEQDEDDEDTVSQQDSSVICHSPCMIFSGSDNQQSQSVSVISGVCPPSYPFYTKPSCEIPKDVQELMDSYQAEIDALLADIANSNSSEQASELTAQLEALQAQLQASEDAESLPLGGGGGGMYVPPPLPPEQSKQAGFGNIPMWAIFGGLGLVALIVIMGSRKAQPVTVKG